MSDEINRRHFLKLAALTGAGVAMSACGAAATATPAKAPTVAPQAAPTATTAVVVSKKIPVTRFMTGGFTAAGKEDNLIKAYQEAGIKKDYGLDVDIQFESASWADIDALVNLRFQTQATDSVQRNDVNVLTWIATAGLIRDLDKEINTYGKNLLAKIPKSAFDFWARADKKMVAIPKSRTIPVDPEFYYIRRDWCTKVGRDVPQTVEDLEEVLRLFKDKKLGGSVTIPILTENPNWILQYALVGPYMQTPEDQFKMMANGQSIERLIGSVMTEGRLTTLARWYKDGLLNNEWPTWQYDQVIDAVSKGMVGAIIAVNSLGNGALQTQVEKADPTQDWVQIFPPPGIKGKPETNRVSTGASMERGLIVATWAPQPEAMVALADWETKDFNNYIVDEHGIEGKHWKWGSGGWIEDLRTAAPNQEYSGMRLVFTSTEWQSKEFVLPAQPGKEPKDALVIPRLIKNLHVRADTTKPEKGEYPTTTQIDHWCPYMFPNSNKFKADLDAIQKEYTTKIIAGQLQPAAGLTEFWSKWMAAGGEARIKEITTQYGAYSAAHPEMKDPHIFLAPDAWNTEIKYPAAKKA